jgi:hypothetical protein
MKKKHFLIISFILLVFSLILSIHFFIKKSQKEQAYDLIRNYKVPSAHVEELILKGTELNQPQIAALKQKYNKTDRISFTFQDYYSVHYLFDNTLRYYALWAISIGLAALSLLIFSLFQSRTKRNIAFTCCILLSLYLCWGAYHYFPPAAKDKPFYRQAELETLKNKIITEHDFSKEEVYFVPTRFFIKAIQHVGHEAVVVKGYILMKFPKLLYPDINKLEFPGAEAVKMVEIPMPKFSRNFQLVQYQFQAYFKKKFSHKYYPFSFNHLWLKMRNEDQYSKIVYVPDAEFHETGFTFNAGVDSEMIIEDQTYEKSFYSIDSVRNTETKNTLRAEIPSIKLNILTKADSPYLLLPPLVLFLALFTLLYIAYPLHKGNALSTLVACIILFMITVVDHYLMHGLLYTKQLIPFDGYYLLLYANLGIFTLIVYLYSFEKISHVKLRSLEMKLKRYLWPVNLGIIYMLGISILY